MSLAVSILDQSPVVSGASARDAVFATLELARAAEALGYHRYWLAEHHSMRMLTDAAPEILLARIATETRRIRVGTGGVLLPHYRALKVAEQFRMLETLSPGRIDLGIGRAPGGTRMVANALGSFAVSQFPQQMRDLVDFLDGSTPPEHPFAKLKAMPDGDSSPDVWLLGSSDYSAALAAEMGLPFAFAHFISGDAPAITRMYRRHFQPSSRAREPRLILAMSAIAADTPEAAEAFGSVVDLYRLRIGYGMDRTVPTIEDAVSVPYTPEERAEVAYNRQRFVVGSPTGVRQQIEEAATLHKADEVMIVSILPNYAARLRSYELFAEAFSLSNRLVVVPDRS